MNIIDTDIVSIVSLSKLYDYIKYMEQKVGQMFNILWSFKLEHVESIIDVKEWKSLILKFFMSCLMTPWNITGGEKGTFCDHYVNWNFFHTESNLSINDLKVNNASMSKFFSPCGYDYRNIYKFSRNRDKLFNDILWVSMTLQSMVHVYDYNRLWL